MFKPSIISLDYETALLDGSPSTEYYRSDFRVISAAAAWRTEDGKLKTRYLTDEDNISKFLQRAVDEGIPLVCHNYQFEYGVTKYRFPGLESAFAYDTMRLVQVGDNGGKEAQRYERLAPKSHEEMLDEVEGDAEAAPKSGLGLQASVSRWLDTMYHDHKEKAYAAIRAKGIKKGNEGSNLHLLTPSEMEQYNVADAVVTLLLYERLTTFFGEIGYDFSLDHALYLGSAKRIAVSKGKGVKVDREALASYRLTIIDEVKRMEIAFRERFASEIAQIESEKADAFVQGVRSPRGQAARQKAVSALLEGEATPSVTKALRFNMTSTKQLASLFIGKLGKSPRFYTEESKVSKMKRTQDPSRKAFTPSPSFKAAHLAGYGEGGEMLVNRKKRLLVLQQVEALLSLSEYDGRWHLDIRAAGTSTGRMAGGQG